MCNKPPPMETMGVVKLPVYMDPDWTWDYGRGERAMGWWHKDGVACVVADDNPDLVREFEQWARGKVML